MTSTVVVLLSVSQEELVVTRYWSMKTISLTLIMAILVSARAGKIGKLLASDLVLC